MSANRRPRCLWAPVALYMALIFGLSSISQLPQLPEGSDKNLHALLYSGLGALLVRALAGGWRAHITLMTAITATGISALYGVSDEFHQRFVPLRQVESLDVLADSIGAAVAALGLYAWGIIQRRNAV